MNAVTPGIRRGLIELRQHFTNAPDLIGLFLTPAITLGVLFFLRNKTYDDSGLSVATLALPGFLASLVAFNGLYLLLNELVLDREDGTLLRAKTIPRGMTGYFVGKIVSVAASVTMQVVIVLAVGAVLIGGLSPHGTGWFTFAWVLVLGLLAALPLGAIFGSFLDTRSAFLLTIPMMGLIAISGIFYPITALPGWLSAIGQLFPMYWLGLGMRSALLPADAVSIEIDGSWRHLETVMVLGVWAAIGLTLAPIVLRRMAGKESGATMAARKDKAMQRAF
ncbi:ABC transporter permease [Nocardia camponoti]|uniref:Transport permease protein n=1 Tax=Nocardia camponoti TaxID=1616106 RepID=A0A917QK44_9NOCA|nr:ABC transporter permease [Nocardia camponoti]GGK53094.1 transport permease protein [Nocardia camponoti]